LQNVIDYVKDNWKLVRIQRQRQSLLLAPRVVKGFDKVNNMMKYLDQSLRVDYLKPSWSLVGVLV